MTETKGAQTASEDPRNQGLLIWLNGRLVPPAEALVSIFGAGFGLGDGVWEGIRLSHGRRVLVDEHLHPLYGGARTIALDIGLSPAFRRAASTFGSIEYLRKSLATGPMSLKRP